ncbi:MAG: sulfatase [Planctomycetes bacterium]|nr:sulfatase [Planctomycetota bacterium]MCB9905004.1 sulfatase [Planctomycetota bacterium]
MSPRTRILFILLGGLVGLGAAIGAGLRPDTRPNLVLIVVDTLRADALSKSAGAAETPAFDALQADGIAFRQAFAHASLTVPSHAAIFSSRLPHQNGVRSNGQLVDTNLPLLAEHLADEGYSTAAAVSLATLWPNEQLRGLDRGFQHYDTGERMVARSFEVLPRVREALDAAQSKEGPFFLFAHFSDPHEPYCSYDETERTASLSLNDEELEVVSTSRATDWTKTIRFGPGTHHLHLRSDDDFKLRQFELTDARGDLQWELTEGELLEAGRSITIRVVNPRVVPVSATVRAWVNDVPSLAEIRARYVAEVEAVDRAVGELIAELKARGLYDQSLIVLTSDHGEGLGEHGIVGHAVQLYDEALHVPLVMKLPYSARPAHLARAAGTLVRHKDLAPTLLRELGVPRLDGATGRVIENTTPRILMAEAHPPEAPQTILAMRDSEYKLIYFAGDDRYELYYLPTDPLELDNVFLHQGHLRTQWQVDLHRLAAESRDAVADNFQADVASRIQALGY